MFYSGHCVKYSENNVVVIEEDMKYRFKQIHAFEWMSKLSQQEFLAQSLNYLLNVFAEHLVFPYGFQ